MCWDTNLPGTNLGKDNIEKKGWEPLIRSPPIVFFGLVMPGI